MWLKEERVNEESGHRGDITVTTIKGEEILDVVVSVTEDTKAMERRKKLKYEKLGSNVTPLAIEVGGKMGKECTDFVNRATKHLDDEDRREAKRELVTDVSVALQSASAKTMWQAMGVNEMNKNVTMKLK